MGSVGIVGILTHPTIPTNLTTPRTLRLSVHRTVVLGPLRYVTRCLNPTLRLAVLRRSSKIPNHTEIAEQEDT